MKKFMLFICATLLVTSCALHQGYLQNSTSLSSNNFNYVKKGLTGTSRAMVVLGFGGGLLKKSLIDEAKRELLRDNPLQNNQALANITVSEKISFFFLVSVQDITVTADIVEFK